MSKTSREYQTQLKGTSKSLGGKIQLKVLSCLCHVQSIQIYSSNVTT